MSKQDWKAALKEKLQQECIYYNRERTCPFVNSPNDMRYMLWYGERDYYHTMLKDARGDLIRQCTDYQFYVGNKLPCKGYQLQRNAAIFNMYCKSSQSAASAVAGFVKLMQQYYYK